MVHPLSYFVSAPDGTDDALIRSDLEDQIGSYAENLTREDKSAFLAVLSRYSYFLQWVEPGYSIGAAITDTMLFYDTTQDSDDEIANTPPEKEEIWDILFTLEGISTESATQLLQFITSQLSDQAGRATALPMPKNWRCLVDEAMEEIEYILYLQELPRISSEQLGLKLVRHETAQHRVGLLLSCYMERSYESINSLKLTLEEMQGSVASRI